MLLSTPLRIYRRIIERVLDYANLKAARRICVLAAIGIFFLSVLFTFLQDIGLVPDLMEGKFLSSYYFSFYLAFTFVLFYETLSMIYTIPRSIADAIGKQYQIMSLIILRGIFEHLGEYSHIHSLSGDWHEILRLLTAGFGSLLIFFLVHIYYRIQPHRKVSQDPTVVSRFVAIKELTTVGLILVMVGLAIQEVSSLAAGIISPQSPEWEISHVFFSNVFTLMIFADVLLVLLTMWYSTSYSIVFRTSALTISTVVLRFSFGEEVELSVVMAIMAVLIGIGVTWIYNRFPDEGPVDH